MRWVYHYTKDGEWMGPGSMFIVAASLYVIAMYCAYLLPVRSNACDITLRNVTQCSSYLLQIEI
jgi:hypothetical protein